MAACTVASACGAGNDGNAVVARDSAGIAIVESRAPAWTRETSWSVSSDPLLDVGSADGPAEYQFSGVEAGVRLADGGIVICDAGSSEIRFYNAAGTFVRAIGRPGDGPGEYRRLTALGRGPGDSLWAYDFGLRRFTVLASDGTAIRTVSVGGSLSAVNAVGQLPNGSFVVKESWSTGTGGDVKEGLERDPIAVVRISADGRTQDTIAVIPGREVFISSEDGRAVMNTPLFAHTSVASVRDSEIVLGDQSTFALWIYHGAGPTHVYRITGVDLRLSRGDVAGAIAARIAQAPPERMTAARTHYAGMAVPETRPAYGALAVDRRGDVWVSTYSPTAEPARAWYVFSPDGRWLGEIRMPERFSVLDIGDDWILGVWRDSLDVERVRLYRLLEPRG